MHPRHRQAFVALVAAVTVLASGCGGDDPVAVPQPTSGLPSTTTTTAPPEPVRTEVCRTVWHAGFRITLTSTLFIAHDDPARLDTPQEEDVADCPEPTTTPGDAATAPTTESTAERPTTSRSSAAKRGTYEGSLTVFVRLRNLTATTREFAPSQVSLELDGEDLPAQLSVKETPGGGTTSGYLTWSDLPGPDLGHGAVTFGSPDEHVSIAPLGEDDGALVANPPTSAEVKLSGTLAASGGANEGSTMDVTVTKVDAATSVENDDTDQLVTAPKDQFVLALTWTATTPGTNFRGGFGTPNVSATAPDGTSATEELAYADLLEPGASMERTSYFVLPEPASGSFQVTFTADNPRSKAPLTLSVPVG